ncbi:hypothetical protein Acr_07g0015450 [Actinidia rufa]|uniref:Uncharacterized protein n=1 Tax=Actinidia rufa TaxID=165716 RepID=A0A7J0EZG6_9ERIC|nr:hypothetical protein Acr_07g0015450 [Actinidia rufa]
MSDRTYLGDFDSSLPSWIFDHLGEKFYMTDEVNMSPSSPKRDFSNSEGSPKEVSLPSFEKESIMILEDVDHLMESYFLSPCIQIRLPEAGKTMNSACPEDGWEFLEEIGREVGEPTILRWWGVPREWCNGLPRLFRDEPNRIGEVASSVEKKGFYSVPNLFKSKTFRRCFGPPRPKAPEDAGEKQPDSLNSSGDVGMSKRLNLKKIGEKVAQSKGGNSVVGPILAKGAVIGEKRLREDLASSPSKKGKVDDGSKGKEVVKVPEGKKKATPSGDVMCSAATSSPWPREGTSANLSTVLGPTTSILGSPSVAKKLLRGVFPLADKEKVDKLTLDQTATKLFHVIGQSLVLGSSLAVRSRKAGEHASLQEGRATSMESEEFRSSLEFLVAVEDAASKYFGKGFNFCKQQLGQHHPALAINLEDMGLDQDLLAEEDEAEEEKQKVGEN